MSAPGRQGYVYRERSGPPSQRSTARMRREAKPPVPVPPGVCPRCREEKSWLRPGETCAPCLLPKGPPAPLVFEDDESKRGVEMAKKKAARMATCEECDEEFEASPFGKLPKRCKDCKARPAAETKASEDEEPEEPEEGAGEGEGEGGEAEAPRALQFNDTHLLVLAELAAARGVDPVEAILTALADSMYGEE